MMMMMTRWCRLWWLRQITSSRIEWAPFYRRCASNILIKRRARAVCLYLFCVHSNELSQIGKMKTTTKIVIHWKIHVRLKVKVCLYRNYITSMPLLRNVGRVVPTHLLLIQSMLLALHWKWKHKHQRFVSYLRCAPPNLLWIHIYYLFVAVVV